MSVLALILFGSRARGDAVAESDTDLLAWTDEEYPSHVRQGGVSIALYPGGLLLRLAAEGDLFAAHLALEAMPLHDPGALLTRLKAAYIPQSDHRPVVAAASDLAWFLVDHHATMPSKLVNARAAWCARTIAIARTAAAGRPLFAPSALADAVDADTLPALLTRRDASATFPDEADLLKRFVARHGDARPFHPDQSSMRRYADLFAATDNGFALKTISRSGLRDEEGSYL